MEANITASLPINPFAKMDIRTLLDEQSEHRGDHPFLLWEPFKGQPERWSYSEFSDRLHRFAAGLQALGVEPGDRILVHMNNSPQQLIAWLGSAYAGAVPVTTNTASVGEDIEYFAEHSQARLALAQMQFAGLIKSSVPHLDVYSDGDPNLLFGGIKPIAEIDGEPESLSERPHDCDAPFSVQYTSGTTTRPKAVLWTHANALWGARQCSLHEDLRADDILLVTLPLYHTNAQSYSILASLWVGASVVLQPEFSASRFWPVSLKHGCTFTSVIPFIIRALSGQSVPKDSNYRVWGSPLCDPSYDEYFRVKSIGWWGMTETITHPIVGSSYRRDKSMSMGRPAPEYEIHILDDNKQPVAQGETGDLYVKGVPGLSLFKEYAWDPEATNNAYTDDGLFITGDRARLDANGYIFFADRSKDMLKVAGENLSASEVEKVIMATGLVAEVAVVAKPHDMKGQVPFAFLIPKEPVAEDLIDDITECCRTRLAAFKVPDEFRIVDSLPRSTLNKIAKNKLREQLERELSARQIETA